MLNSERGRELIRSIPEDRLLTETDSPFVEIGDHRSIPQDTAGFADDLAAVNMQPAGKIRKQLVENSIRVLKFAGLDSSRMPVSI
jgi:TatD DNase family protein